MNPITYTSTYSAFCTQAVATTAKALDQTIPGWENMIDTNRLDLWSGQACIFGQLRRKSEVRALLGEDATWGWDSLFDAVADKSGTSRSVMSEAVIGHTTSPQHRAWLQEIAHRVEHPTIEQELTRLLAGAKPKPKFEPTREEIEAARAQVARSYDLVAV